MSEFCDIQKLAELFNPKTGDSDSDDDERNTTAPCNNINPSNLEPPNSKSKKEKNKKVNPYSQIDEKRERREILDPDREDDFVFDEENNPKADWKKTPKWDISYRQQVTASDVFLQMGFKNPATASCEDMIFSIQLPGDDNQHMDLKILKDRLTLVSPRYYLDLPLPHPVDPQRGNAKWDKDEDKLIITLKMDRELDLLNF